MVIGIEVTAENIRKKTTKHTNSSYFTMVAVDEEDGKPVKVPGLILQTSGEVGLFIAAMHRKKLNEYYQKESRHVQGTYNKEDYITLLAAERCRLEIQV